jgi:hypothetical protein
MQNRDGGSIFKHSGGHKKQTIHQTAENTPPKKTYPNKYKQHQSSTMKSKEDWGIS